MKNYTVQPGDTLFGIAAREYGDGELYPVIAHMNNLANPDLIFAGQELLVPYVTYRHLWTTDDTTAARAQITQQYYGTQDSKMQLIWEVASGVAQQPIERGAWLLIPELGDVGHHTVVDGESFPTLAARWYGDDRLAVVIAFANQMDPDTEPTPRTVLIRPGLNFRLTVAGHTLESACRLVYGDSELIPTWMDVVAAANHLGHPHKLFATQRLHFPR
ncbi:peptidoglycan-binding protein LysM [Mycolicibacterium agri]|uniref:Peptidoglycan-binding protein LysM n=1 Tax=Mycolicibacterium agri TaxID=36811 RepID=A0A2A7NFN1_MYCAG|nr:LysM domain-containing protein [Mycolicibacterium agri]PEG42659.1 peptidoglycan-binding protein LysM [Mycolicibacterium agri]GFG52633.1 peptidoglycan-binding protein LysM [Mycolicibacterium agri]